MVSGAKDRQRLEAQKAAKRRMLAHTTEGDKPEPHDWMPRFQSPTNTGQSSATVAGCPNPSGHQMLAESPQRRRNVATPAAAAPAPALDRKRTLAEMSATAASAVATGTSVGTMSNSKQPHMISKDPDWMDDTASASTLEEGGGQARHIAAAEGDSAAAAPSVTPPVAPAGQQGMPGTAAHVQHTSTAGPSPRQSLLEQLEMYTGDVATIQKELRNSSLSVEEQQEKQERTHVLVKMAAQVGMLIRA